MAITNAENNSGAAIPRWENTHQPPNVATSKPTPAGGGDTEVPPPPGWNRTVDRFTNCYSLTATTGQGASTRMSRAWLPMNNLSVALRVGRPITTRSALTSPANVITWWAGSVDSA